MLNESELRLLIARERWARPAMIFWAEAMRS